METVSNSSDFIGRLRCPQAQVAPATGERIRRTAILQGVIDKQLPCLPGRATPGASCSGELPRRSCAHGNPVPGQRFIPDIRAKSPITFCMDSNADPPDDITPCIADTTFCICVMSGIMAIAAFACLAPGMPAI